MLTKVKAVWVNSVDPYSLPMDYGWEGRGWGKQAMGLHDASNIVSMASYRHMARTGGRQKDVGRRQEERKHRKNM